MIDLHCHYLPGIDDGSQSMAESLDLARASVADGITHAVMTPHIHPGRYENTRTTVIHAVAAFREALNAAGVPLQIYAAGEVRLSSDVIELLEQNELPFLGTLNGYRVLLLEFPYGQIPVGTEKLARWLLAQKIRPLIAHPERNKVVMHTPEKLRIYIEMGCLIQITAGSLLGQFGVPVQECAVALLDRGWVSLIASDAHNLLHRSPMMTSARNWLIENFGAALADQFTMNTPAKILGIDQAQLTHV
jgi:protein-tyrosine phosphatase